MQATDNNCLYEGGEQDVFTYYIIAFGLLILAELVKGLSANGTPPVLQRFSWQMDLAHFMWSNIRLMRIGLIVVLAAIFYQLPQAQIQAVIITSIPLGLIWGFVYWLFNRYWVGKFKFLPISVKRFEGAAKNTVSLDTQILGVSQNGEAKAFPANMLFYHHQIKDEIAGHPIIATYCGLCRSGRVYDALVDGNSLEFTLVGAITWNAVFSDNVTGSWWRQETGEAAKGPMKGRMLEDVPFEQMSLETWLAKYPDSQILQYDPAFERKYAFTSGLLSYELSLPGWHMQSTPPLILGVDIGNEAKAYDWNTLIARRFAMDEVGGTPLLVQSDAKGETAFAYDRRIDGDVLEFTLDGDALKDVKTGSHWDQFGRCIKGKLKGSELTQIQSYKQYLRAWISFHPQSGFYNF